jgi:hypothetical protein
MVLAITAISRVKRFEPNAGGRGTKVGPLRIIVKPDPSVEFHYSKIKRNLSGFVKRHAASVVLKDWITNLRGVTLKPIGLRKGPRKVLILFSITSQPHKQTVNVREFLINDFQLNAGPQKVDILLIGEFGSRTSTLNVEVKVERDPSAGRMAHSPAAIHQGDKLLGHLVSIGRISPFAKPGGEFFTSLSRSLLAQVDRSLIIQVTDILQIGQNVFERSSRVHRTSWLKRLLTYGVLPYWIKGKKGPP